MPSLFLSVALLLLERWANFHRLAQHILLRRCIRIFYGYVLSLLYFISEFFRIMHMHYNWRSILFDSAALHDLDAQMLQWLYSFAIFSHKRLYLVKCVNTLRLPSRSVSVLLPNLHTICDVQLIPYTPQHTVQYQDGLLFYSGYIIRRCLAHLCAVPSMDICIPVNSSAFGICAQSLILVFQWLWRRSQIKGRITKFWSSIDDQIIKSDY
jgi:hypothetical protein